MKITVTTMASALLLALGCASHPAPVQQMADAQSANRSATELGAQKHPRAQLHLKLADEQVQLAKAAMDDDETERAESLLARAKADAELAIAITRAADAEARAQKAMERLQGQSGESAKQGEPQ